MSERHFSERLQESQSQYEGVEDADLIGRFYDSEGDPDIGRELSVRILKHAEFQGDPTVMPLIGRDGAQVKEDGKPLVLADYINFAANHHFDALEEILDFLMTEKGTPHYETVRSGMLGRLNPGGA